MKLSVAFAGALLAAALLAAPVSAQLPDGRVYEQVSQVDKNGNLAGAVPGFYAVYSVASPDGGAIVYGTGGPQGETQSGNQPLTRSRRTATGWTTTAALPRPRPNDGKITFGHLPKSLLPADDLSRFVFWSPSPWHPDVPWAGDQFTSLNGLYVGGYPDPVDWINRPTDDDPVYIGDGGDNTYHYPRPAGGSRDLSRVYFSFLGTLVPEDEPRKPQAAARTAEGFYEYSNGVLKAAGVLPDGTVDSHGAVPASTVNVFIGSVNAAGPDDFGNQISADGRNALFVSPDPRSGSGRTSQLYLRKDGQSTVLVSKSQTSGAPAPSGPHAMAHPRMYPGGGGVTSYALATPDGSTVFFQSVDPLTADAPAGGDLKAYRYDVASDTVSYVAGLAGRLLRVSDDGSRVAFATDDISEIRLWHDGDVTTVAELVPGGTVNASRMTPDGSALVFQTQAAVTGFPNSFGVDQVYHYDLAADDLSCVSCPPNGEPSGPASVTGGGSSDADGWMKGSRGLSADGRQVFFDTTDGLVERDVNGKRDVYRWREGSVALISSGRHIYDSYFIDSDEAGEDVFFTTQENLVPLDRDGAYDIYDARIGGGFGDEQALAPCSASCRGDAPPAPGLPPLATVAFDGSGNVAAKVRVAKARLRGWKLRGGRIALAVRVPGAGRVTVTGAGLRRAGRRVGKAGAYRLEVALARSAQRRLRRNGRLALRVHVRFVSRGGHASKATFRLTVKG